MLCSQPLPDDHALSFAAFQKLLLLGLLAPLEEATAAASGRKGGQHVALAAARADRQRIAAARQVWQVYDDPSTCRLSALVLFQGPAS